MSILGSSAVVLKFGSSVLRAPSSLPIAVAEIYRQYRGGRSVVAVVSAFEGVTDALLMSIDGAEGKDPATVAALLSTGEIASAAGLVLALHKAGIPSRVVDPRDMGLTATGDATNAELTHVDEKKLQTILEESPVIVVPGFFAQSAQGGLALLGRGGSDLTALHLAATLGAGCVLLKDVDGLYETDPATSREVPRRFAQADYATAEAHAGTLVQPKAVRFASDRLLPLDITRVGSSACTRIAEGPSAWAPLTQDRPPIRVALLGMGTVGGGVFDYLSQFPERFEVVSILVHDLEKFRECEISRALLVDTPEKAFARSPEIVVEALPGIEPARKCLALALNSGARVVTANKALVAAQWDAIEPELSGPRRSVRYAGTVGGAVPMLETVERLRRLTPIASLRGVVNGTCNYVLDRCAGGASLAHAVRGAQELGFAETDPSADLSGLDAARKIEILGRIAFGGTPVCEAISGIHEKSCFPRDADPKKRVALIAEAQRSDQGFVFKVAARELPTVDFLAGARGAENRLEIIAQDGTVTQLRGLGAGRVPTATAVFADVLEHARIIEQTRDYIVMDEVKCSSGVPGSTASSADRGKWRVSGAHR
ncbi:MAG TPA: hypothetical protein VHY75_08730 [Steroidobacteraceae bacterium]|jgi:homoserine dehydrogenase|nr:hypothetical protein [Steroidobacteraceae bacterium]